MPSKLIFYEFLRFSRWNDPWYSLAARGTLPRTSPDLHTMFRLIVMRTDGFRFSRSLYKLTCLGLSLYKCCIFQLLFIAFHRRNSSFCKLLSTSLVITAFRSCSWKFETPWQRNTHRSRTLVEHRSFAAWPFLRWCGRSWNRGDRDLNIKTLIFHSHFDLIHVSLSMRWLSCLSFNRI